MLARLTLFSLALAACSTTYGSIQLNPVPAGSATVVFEGNATFTRLRSPTFGPSLLDATIVQKTFSGTTTIDFNDVTYAAGDLDITSGALGFRWAERITNSTSYPISGLTMTLSSTIAFFDVGGLFAQPSFITINAGGPLLAGLGNVLLSDDFPNPVGADSLGTAIVSGSGNQILTFTLNTPVAPGDSFDVYAAIRGLSSPTSGALGSFGLTESVSQVVPEASSLVIWGVIAFACGQVCWLTRRARASHALAPSK